NLGGGGAIYDNTTAPHVAPGDSIWLGTFVVTVGVAWTCNTNSAPAWVAGSATSVVVYDLPPTIASNTTCNSLGTGLSLTSGKLENGTNGGVNPCNLLFVCGAACANPPTANAGLPQTICSVGIANLNGTIGGGG